MNQGILTNLRQNKWLFSGVIIAAVGLLALIIFFIIISLTPRTNYELTPLNTSGGNVTTQLKGDKLYSYSGAAFLSTDLNSNEPPQVLHSGLKLPLIRQVKWADSHGVLATFEAGFTYTEVEKYLEENNISLFSDYSNYVWYIDFSDGSLAVVTTEPLLSNQIYYSRAANGFYLTLNNLADSAHNTVFYSIENKSLSAVEDMPPLSVVTHIGGCFDDSAVCVTGYDSTESAEPTIYKIDATSHEVSTLISSDGSITPTSHPDIYLIRAQLKEDEDQPEAAADDHADVNIPLGPGELYNITTEKHQATGVDIEGETITTLIGSEVEDIAYLSFEQGTEYTSRAKTLFGNYHNRSLKLSNSSDQPMPDIIIPLHSGESEKLLVTDADTNLYVISKKGSINREFKPVSADDIGAIIGECKSAGVGDYSVFQQPNSADIFISASSNSRFLNTVKKVSSCLAKQLDSQPDYRFNFKGTDPSSGRIIIN